ncbi:MAG: glycoside hydrolase family 3 N-terminal domain-containing protein [Coprobacillaceae bacterium]
MKRTKLTKVVAGVMTAGTVLSLMTPTAIHADDTTYSVVTKTDMYSVEQSTQVPLSVDYVTNPNGGPTLGLVHIDGNSDGKNDYLLEEVDGIYTYAFKDMNKNGALDPYEDWRLSVDDRAEDLASSLAFDTSGDGKDGIRKIAGLMLFSSHETNSANGLTTSQEGYLNSNYVRNITDAAGNNVKDSVGWVNAMQAYVETETDFNVPVDFSSDPRSTAGSGDLYSGEAENSDISAWPSNIGMAATFDTDHMYNFAKATSAEYRALGIVTALGPQIDLATEPRWLRTGGTFGENTLLATDMAQAYVDGSQSTYAADGTDLGWGEDSINCMIKHFPGDGAGEGGRESHTASGKYAVYPGNNFDEHLIPFTEGGLKLNGETGSATAVMTSYSIGIDAEGNALGGERVGSAYSSYKMDILRNDLEFDGVVCTDWGVTSDPASGFGMAWGVDGTTVAEKHYMILMAGSDMFGGNNAIAPIVDAFDMMVADSAMGEQAARERFAESAERLIKLTMEPGLFENPYLDLDNSLAVAGSTEKVTNGYNAQLDSIVMLKNANNTIQDVANGEKQPSEMTVYIPYTYTEEQPGIWGNTPAAWSPSMSLEVAESIYGTVITDDLTYGGSGEITNATPPADLSGVDKVIVGMRSPINGGLFSNTGRYTKEDGSFGYYPLSLQYGEYTADGDNVRTESIAGDTGENRSYYGETSRLLNPYDLTAVLNSVAAVVATGKDIPVVVAMNASGPAIVSEFEDKVDAIVVGFSVSDSAVFEVINGEHEARGLLPMQFPANMDTVEANQEDVAGDLVCYKDTEGNTYDVAYGLNWDGIIDDARVAKYNADRPTTNPDVTVTISPDKAEVKQGGTLQFTASVESKARLDTSVTWTVEGATSSNTKVSADGLLTVGEDETVGSVISVVASSAANPSTSAKATITIAKKDTSTTGTGTGNGSGTVTSPTSTGDNTNSNGYLIALVASMALAATCVVVYRKKKITE